MSSEPDSELTELLETGMVYIETLLELKGVKVNELFVGIHVDGMEPDSAVAGHGFEGELDLIAWMLQMVRNMSRQAGIPIHFMPIRGEG